MCVCLVGNEEETYFTHLSHVRWYMAVQPHMIYRRFSCEFESMEQFYGDIRDQIKIEFTKLFAMRGTIEIQTFITGTYVCMK